MKPSEEYFIDRGNLELTQNYTNRIRHRIEKLGSKSEDIDIENLKNISDMIIQINSLILTGITIFIAIKNKTILFYEKLITIILIVLIFGSITYELWVKRKFSKYLVAYFITYEGIFKKELSDFYSTIESQKISNFNKINPEKKSTLTNEQKEDLSVLNYMSVVEVQEKLYKSRKLEIDKLMGDFNVLQERINCKRLLGYIILGVIFASFLLLLSLMLF